MLPDREILPYGAPTPPLFARLRSWRRVIVAVAAIAFLVMAAVYLPGAWRAWRLVAKHRHLAQPIVSDLPLYDENPATVGQLQGRHNYTAVPGTAGYQHLPGGLDGATWRPGAVLLYTATWTLSQEKRDVLLSVYADVQGDRQERTITLGANVAMIPTWYEAWTGKRRGKHLGELADAFRLQDDDWITIMAGRSTTADRKSVAIPFVLNGKRGEIVGAYGRDPFLEVVWLDAANGEPQGHNDE